MEQVKVVVIGSIAVGKTSLTIRFIYDQFNQTMETTLGASYFEKVHEYAGNQAVKFQFWDTAGQEKYKAIAKIYYKDAKAAIVVYDVSNRESFDSLQNWIKELRTHGPQDLILAIVGNKIDKLQQQVPLKQAQEYANSLNAIFKLTSAKQNKGIKQLFDSIANRLNSIKQTTITDRRGTNLRGGKSKEKKKEKCC